MTTVYILKLEDNKYYVGETRDIKKRTIAHFSNTGSEWTKKYKPIQVLKIIPKCDKFNEDKYTKIYMEKYGIDNVRGGSYTQISLSKEQILLLKTELNTANRECFTCGRAGHYAYHPHNYEV